MNNINSVPLLEPQKAISALEKAHHETFLILDFDETLLLRNSTAAYIDSFRPQWLGYLVILTLKVLRPWQWFPGSFRGDRVRDWFLVTVPTILMPWTLSLWRKNAGHLGQVHQNSELVSIVQQHARSKVIVASLGFKFIIEPMLSEIPLQCDLLVGCRFWQGAGDRQKGKLAMMQEVLTSEEIEQAILVTDSHDDLPLLQVVGQPCLVQWPEAQYVEPFRDSWLYGLLKKALRH